MNKVLASNDLASNDLAYDDLASDEVLWSQHVGFAVGAYVLASFLEWYIHKELMHATTGWAYRHVGRSHIAHHSDTREDMSLKSSDRPQTAHNPPGIHIPYTDTVMLMLAYTLGLVGLNWLCGTQLRYTVLVFISVCAILAHNFVWNCVHCEGHCSKPQYRDGVPRVDGLMPAAVHDYMVWYHKMHHLSRNATHKCNYNIVLPGADWLLGTYSSHPVI